ncbi:MAG TPA: aldo/keto reductase [Candidatus Baltobacteraceae bacterium]|jgi:diketogulonate reductase-like aldo/keto reductase|nr:aldo/keto reductase [Candidatus Baltobacteraceae bacterium]
MDRKRFGAAQCDVPVIGQGTWDLPESGARRSQAIAALRAGIELGMTHIDTAEMYGSGRVEEMVAEAIHGIDRTRLFLTTKVLPGNASYDGTIAACERSLRRLRVEYVDLYLLHWPSSFPIEETMRALATLVSQGKTRFAGVSNFDVDELAKARAALAPLPLVCDQVLYHLNERTAEARLVPYAAANDIAVVGYTPFGRGRFPRAQAAPPGVLGRIAAAHGKTARQVILNFLTRERNTFAIPKASTPEHVRENAGASGWRLEAHEVAEMDAAFPVHDGPLATL